MAVVPVSFLILCSCVVYTMGRLIFFKSSRDLCPRFSVCLSILITTLGEDEAGLCASRKFVCLFCASMILSFFSSSWCQGLAEVCNCGIPWTFLLIFSGYDLVCQESRNDNRRMLWFQVDASGDFYNM